MMISGALSSWSRFQTVISVDNAAIKIVEIGSGKPAAIQRNEWTQVRRNDGNHFQHHPLGAIAGDLECLDDLQAFGQALLNGFTRRLCQGQIASLVPKLRYRLL